MLWIRLHFKRYLFFAGCLLSMMNAAKADDYQFTVDAKDPSQAIAVKNCLDYTKCGGAGMSLHGTLSHQITPFTTITQIRLSSDLEAATALKNCKLTQQGVFPKIKNITTGKTIEPLIDDGDDLAELNFLDPNVYMRSMSEDEKTEAMNGLKVFLKNKDLNGAVTYSLKTYRLNSGDFNLFLELRKENESIAVNGMETDATISTLGQNATISFSRELLDENKPCRFLLVLRHELEHASQNTRVNNCEIKSAKHNLQESKQRERAAYFNDFKNLDQYCPKSEGADSLKLGTWFEYYTYFL